MDDKQFFSDIEELLELDSGILDSSTDLESIQSWDSLAFVSFLAVADSKYGVKVAPKELQQCKTIGDLMKLVAK